MAPARYTLWNKSKCILTNQPLRQTGELPPLVFVLIWSCNLVLLKGYKLFFVWNYFNLFLKRIPNESERSEKGRTGRYPFLNMYLKNVNLMKVVNNLFWTFSISMKDVRSQVCFDAISSNTTSILGIEELKILMTFQHEPVSGPF